MTDPSDLRILILADVNSAHVQRWASGLAKRGLQIAVWSFDVPANDWYSKHRIKVYAPDSPSFFGKFRYFFAEKKAQEAIDDFRPHVVHAHYASSYGMIGRKTGFHPFFISVWGSDITHFPNGMIRRSIMRKNLDAADRIFATSHMLTQILEHHWGVEAVRMPFGVDTEKFQEKKFNHYFPSSSVVVGTVKALESIYAIDFLLAAFSMVQKRRPDLPLRLLIAGDGSLRNNLIRQASRDCIPETVKFVGKVPYDAVPLIHQEIDIFMNVSQYESFGVSVLEASSCGKPVIVTETGGLPEVVEDDETGYLVSVGSIVQMADAIERLAENVALRATMGTNGRFFAASKYNWDSIIEDMVGHYRNVVDFQ